MVPGWSYIGDTVEACIIKCVPILRMKGCNIIRVGYLKACICTLVILGLNLDTFTTLVRIRVASPGIYLEVLVESHIMKLTLM